MLNLNKHLFLLAACITATSLTTATAQTKKPPAKKEQPAKPVTKKSATKKPPPSAALPVPSDPKQIYGWKEKVSFKGLKPMLEAKLDTGARTSSLHATSQKVFERDGDKWVSFKTEAETKSGTKSYQLEAPLVRTTLIKEPNGESVRRNVVRLTFTIGDRQLRSEFTLNNRNNMICPVLIGRSSIKSLGWIDAGRTNLADKKILR